MVLKRVKVSNNVIRRLPRYLRKLDELTAEGIGRISSHDLGLQLGLTPSQIRQDFSCFGEFGQQGYGYNVAALREQVAAILGMDRGFRAILIGVGNIGNALMDNFCFSEWGFHLLCAFDINPELIGKERSGVPIRAMDELESFLSETPVDVAVLEFHQCRADAAGQQHSGRKRPFFGQSAVAELFHFRAQGRGIGPRRAGTARKGKGLSAFDAFPTR